MSSNSVSSNGSTLFANVHGHELAKNYFERALSTGRVSHAYLLVGPRGVGKALFAQRLAQVLLCRDSNACGDCVSCRTLASGNHTAFVRVAPEDGKDIDIATVRDTIEELSLRAGERCVVIFDDADRFGAAASHALLKTLEEPPPGTVFLLVTSRPSRLLDTIHSRCNRVPFGALTPEEYSQVVTDNSIPGLYEATGGSPGVALELLRGVEGAGGLERFDRLLAGEGADRPESLVDYVPEQGKETKRERVRRLLELVLQGLWGRHRDGERSLEVSELLTDVAQNHNPELVLEDLAKILSARSAPPAS